MFTLALVLWHKGTCPGRCVLYERAGELDACFVCVAKGVGSTGVRDTASSVCFGRGALCKCATATVTCHFYVTAFVARCRVAVVNPEEGAYSHLFARLYKCNVAIWGEFHDFAWAEVADVVVAKVWQGAAFLQGDHGTVFFTEDNRGAAPLVAACVELAVAAENEHGAATLDLFLNVLETVYNGILGGNEC